MGLHQTLHCTVSILGSGIILAWTLLAIANPPAHGQDPQNPVPAKTEVQGPELRIEAFAILEKSQREAHLAWFQSIVTRVRELPEARPLARPRYVLRNHREHAATYDESLGATPYPHFPAVAQEAGTEALPVILVPPRASLDTWLQRNSGALDAPEEHDRPAAGTLYFDPAPLPRNEVFPCPMAAEDLLGSVNNPQLKTFVDVGLQGKVLGQADTLRRARRAVEKMDQPILGRTDVVEVTPGLYALRFAHEKKATDTWALPIADANGAARRDRSIVDPTLGSWFENRVESSFDLEKVGRHLRIVVARPLPIGSESLEVWRLPRSEWSAHRVQERVVVTREMLAKTPVIAVERAETWKPYMEDVRLVPWGQDGRILSLVISLDADTETLVSTVGRLFQVDALAVAKSAGWLKDVVASRPK